MKTSRLPPSADGFVPAWPCSRRGLPDDLHYCKRRWSLTPPFHPHPAQARGGLFLWPLSGRFAPYGGFPPRELSDAVLYGVRTFLDDDNASPRSPNQPEARSSYTQGGGASTAGRSNIQAKNSFATENAELSEKISALSVGSVAKNLRNVALRQKARHDRQF